MASQVNSVRTSSTSLGSSGTGEHHPGGPDERPAAAKTMVPLFLALNTVSSKLRTLSALATLWRRKENPGFSW
jgi:hypothetical protein